MNKMEYCKWAHEHKDEIMEMMMNGEPITDSHLLQFLALSEICSQNIMEMQREKIWQPLNSQLRQADGMHTVYIDNTSHFMNDIKGHDVEKAMKHLLKHMDNLKMTDPAKYSSLIAEIKA